MLLWPVVLVAFLGATVLEATWPVVLTFTGVALAVLLRIYREYGTLDENEILEKIRR